MNSIKRLRQRRDLDLFFFHGIPEIPEHMYGFGFHSFDSSRTTRKGILEKKRNNGSNPYDEPSTIWRYDPESGLFDIVYTKPK